MSIRVCLAGATGWAGSALARAIAQTDDITLGAAVARTHAGRSLADVLSEPALTCRIYATAEEALVQPCDVFFEFTRPEVAKANVLAALDRGAHAVIGTSGLSDEDYTQIARAAQQRQRGVLAVGNFAITVVLLQKFAEIAARFIPQWEIIDYASDAKPDAPSGTVRELAHRLSQVRQSELTVPLEDTQGVRENSRRPVERLPGAFRSPAGLHHLGRGHLRHARSAAQPAPRLRQRRPAVRRRRPAGHPQGAHAHRPAARTG